MNHMSLFVKIFQSMILVLLALAGTKFLISWNWKHRVTTSLFYPMLLLFTCHMLPVLILQNSGVHHSIVGKQNKSGFMNATDLIVWYCCCLGQYCMSLYIETIANKWGCVLIVVYSFGVLSFLQSNKDYFIPDILVIGEVRLCVIT